MQLERGYYLLECWQRLWPTHQIQDTICLPYMIDFLCYVKNFKFHNSFHLYNNVLLITLFYCIIE